MKTAYDYIIIGAGPAGLQLGYFMEQDQRDYLILERGTGPGVFFKLYPRHRTLISINKIHTGKQDPEANLRWDWNSLIGDDESLLFKNYSDKYFPHPDDLVRYLEDYARHYNLNIRYGSNVTRVIKNSQGEFEITDRKGATFTAKRLIVATGLFKPMTPDIPGGELCDTYNNHSIRPADYTGKRVLIIGKGNSAFETADNLTETAAAIHVLSPNSVKMAWETHFVGNLRAVNNNFLDTYQLKSQNTVIDASVKNITMDGDQYVVDIAYTHAKGQTRRLRYDHVILCTGWRFDTAIFDDSCKPELIHNDKLPAQTTEWESKNIAGLYFAGTVMQACDYKKTMSGFIHGFRHNVEALNNILGYKYHDQPWPSEAFPLSVEGITQKIIDRANNAAGIFLQPGFMAEVIVVDEQNQSARLFSNFRKDHIPNSFLANEDHYYVLSLEYGKFDGDPFNVERDPAPDMAHEAAYLHPIIRRYNGHQLVAVHHIQDDLESEWHLPEYVEPARAFFEDQLAQEQATTPA
jgi:thioredoxin reductase